MHAIKMTGKKQIADHYEMGIQTMNKLLEAAGVTAKIDNYKKRKLLTPAEINTLIVPALEG